MARPSTTGVRGLYRDADGNFRIDLRWKEPKTGEIKRFRQRFPEGTKAAVAKRRAEEVWSGAMAGTFDPDRVEPAKAEALKPAMDRWLDYCETYGIKSVGSRRTHAKALVDSLGTSRALDAIDLPAVERFKTTMGKKRKPATVNRHVATLKTFAEWARKHAGMPPAVALMIREDVKLLPEPEGRKRYLSPDEEKTVAEKLTGWIKPIALACKLTGARLGEITGLRWLDVDRRARVVRFTKTKTGRTREVPIVPELAEILDALPAGAPGAFVFAVPRRQGRPGPVKRTEEARRRDVASRAWASFCEEAGLADLHAHDLRHHAATMIRRAGGGLDTVAKVLGHTNIRTAARYAHVEVEDTRAFLEAAAGRGFAHPLPTTSEAAATNSPEN